MLPNIRGCGPFNLHRHTASYQNSEDEIALLDHLNFDCAVIGGAGLGATISLRTAVAYPRRVNVPVLIGAEDIEDNVAKQAEIVFMEAFASWVRM